MTGRPVICQDVRRSIYVNRDIAGWLAPFIEKKKAVPRAEELLIGLCIERSYTHWQSSIHIEA